MSETKFYVVENTESLWYKAKSNERIYFWLSTAPDKARKHVWICECSNLNTPVIVRIKWLKSTRFGFLEAVLTL